MVDVTDQQVLGQLVASSAETPLILALYLADDAASGAVLTSLANTVGAPGSGVRLGLVEVNELPQARHARCCI